MSDIALFIIAVGIGRQVDTTYPVSIGGAIIAIAVQGLFFYWVWCWSERWSEKRKQKKQSKQEKKREEIIMNN